MAIGGRLARAGLAGLTLAMAVAAVGLLVAAVMRLQVDCSAVGPEECTFERSLASSIARQQALAALGLASLGGGLFLVLRRSRPG